MKKCLFAFLILVLMASCATVSAEEENGWIYKVDKKGQATLTGYTGEETSLVLPETLGGYPVVAIGRSAFENNTTIKKVVIPDCYTTIGAYAFSGCSRISYLKLGSGIQSWEEHYGTNKAFADCVNLFEIEFTPGITCIGKEAFMGCTLLDAVYLPDTVTIVDGGAFRDCELLDIADVYGDIAGNAFRNCSYMSDLTIHNATYIGAHAFQGCTSISGVELPDTLLSIGGEAFRGCSKLAAIVIPNTVTKISYRAFMDCMQLKSATIGCSITEWPEEYSDSSVFANCPVLVDITFVPGITYLPNNMFNGCRSLKYIELPEGLISIGKSVFVGCNALETVVFPSTLQSVGNYSFDGCSQLKEAVLPDQLLVIGNGAFRKTALTEVVIPAKCTDIGYYAFRECPVLEHVTLGESVTTWKEDYGCNGAFMSCPVLKTLTIENGVNSIGNYAFRYCPMLETVEIPSTSVAVGEYAFADCTSLRDVTIYRGDIEKNAFDGCISLENVTLRKVTSIGTRAFIGCTKLNNMELPRTLLTIGNWAFEKCETITEVVVPDSTTYIGCYAFRNCSNLKRVHIGNNISTWGTEYGTAATFLECGALEYVNFSAGLTEVPEAIFNKCASLKGVYIPESVVNINKNAFKNVPNSCVIYGTSGSQAEVYAQNQGYMFSTEAFPVSF